MRARRAGLGLVQVPTLSPSHEVQCLFGRRDAQEEGATGGLGGTRPSRLGIHSAWCPDQAGPANTPLAPGPPGLQSGKQALSVRGRKVMSHSKPIQASGREGEQLSQLEWSAPTSGRVPQHLGSRRGVQGTSLVHAKFTWSSWVPGGRDMGRGRGAPFSPMLFDDS